MKYFIKILSWCGYIGILFLLNVSFVKAADIEVKKQGALMINGKIENGDYAKFMDKLSQVFALSSADFKEWINKLKEDEPIAYKKWAKKYGEPKGLARITIYLNSSGGDIVEAMKIGKAVRDMLLPTETGFYFEYKGKSQEIKCMSACFFVWVAGVERSATLYRGESPLGIHRLRFNREYYKGLSSDNAEIEYEKMKDSAKEYLQTMGVPNDYLIKMFNVPSNEIYILSKDEVYSLEGKTPYFEELLFSRCGSYTKQEWQDYADCTVTWPQEFISQESIKRCEALSSGYLDYVKLKIEGIAECWRVHWDIERWKRMNKYFSKKNPGRE